MRKGMGERARVAVVTGGARGIGKAVARGLASEGYAVALVGRVNAVCPGTTSTAMMETNIRSTMRERALTYEEAHTEWVRDIPVKMAAEPEDVANAVVFLASDRARMITGEELNVSGGAAMW